MDQIMMIENDLIVLIQAIGNWLELPMQVFTFLGNELFFLLVMPAIFWSIDPVIGFRTGMMLILSGGLNSALKMLFVSPRPYWTDSRVLSLSSESSFGFPSGHSQNSAAIWGMMAANLRKKWAFFVTILVVFLVGFSRLYLGVHFFRDVLGGWLFGVLLILIYFKLERPVGNYLAKRRLSQLIFISFIFSISLILIGLIAISINNTYVFPEAWTNQAVKAGAEIPDPFNIEGLITMAGVAFGFTAGYALWLKKDGNLKIHCSPAKRIFRYFIGLIGIVALYFGLKIILPEDPIWLGYLLRFFRYFLIGFWVTAVAPWCFKKLGLND